MAEPQKRNRHPDYRTAYRVKNWREYEQSLRDRGDITLWISQDAIDAWTPAQTDKRGAQPVYSDLAIETALALRLPFHLPLRQTEGFLGSVLGLMGLALPYPDHTTLSRRNATIAVRQHVDRTPQGPISLIVDSTDLKVCGQGEWHAHKHGDKKRRFGEDGVPVMHEKAVGVIAGYRLSELLHGPLRRGMRRHIDMEQSSAGMFDDDQHIEEAEGGGDRHAEVACHDAFGVIADKGGPALRLSTVAWAADTVVGHIFTHRSRRDFQAELQQELVGDALLAVGLKKSAGATSLNSCRFSVY